MASREMRYLLDTNTCIDVMRDYAAVVKRLSEQAPDDCVLSTITSYELYTGVAKCKSPATEKGRVDLLLRTVHELAFDLYAARESAAIRAGLETKGQAIGPYDTLLAGHARSAGLVLVTSNTAEFGRVPGLKLENWRATA